jgi:hypothetical protein
MMTVNERKAELLRRAVTTAALAARAQPPVTPAMIRAVVSGKEKSRRLRVLIARAIGKKVADVFG